MNLFLGNFNRHLAIFSSHTVSVEHFRRRTWRLFMELFVRRRWRIVSAQLSIEFGYCPSSTVSIVLLFHEHNSLLLGRYEPSSPISCHAPQIVASFTNGWSLSWTTHRGWVGTLGGLFLHHYVFRKLCLTIDLDSLSLSLSLSILGITKSLLKFLSFVITSFCVWFLSSWLFGVFNLSLF